MKKDPATLRNQLGKCILSRDPDFSIPYLIGNGKEVRLSITNTLYISSETSGTHIHLVNHRRESIHIAQAIGEIEKNLQDYGFLRIHRLYLVNISYIKSYRLDKQAIVVIKDGSSLPIAKRRRMEVSEYLSCLGIDSLPALPL